MDSPLSEALKYDEVGRPPSVKLSRRPFYDPPEEAEPEESAPLSQSLMNGGGQ